MRLSLFESFADMIETIPARAIVRTLVREQRMLEEDLFCQRPVPFKEAESILHFCRFVNAIREESPVATATLPSGHLEFYRETVERLVAAEELPFDATTEFETAFIGGTLRSLVHA